MFSLFSFCKFQHLYRSHAIVIEQVFCKPDTIVAVPVYLTFVDICLQFPNQPLGFQWANMLKKQIDQPGQMGRVSQMKTEPEMEGGIDEANKEKTVDYFLFMQK